MGPAIVVAPVVTAVVVGAVGTWLGVLKIRQTKELKRAEE